MKRLKIDSALMRIMTQRMIWLVRHDNKASAVLWLMSGIADDRGYARCTISELVDATELKRAKIKQCLKILSDCGFIVKVNGEADTYYVDDITYFRYVVSKLPKRGRHREKPPGE